eukprot:m.84140 g.84140  ORF g.84140 m.84140 type:complete len:839 (-) comp8708_c0_seq4:1416-3932(-)
MVWVVDIEEEEQEQGKGQVWIVEDCETAHGETKFESIDRIIASKHGLKWFKGKVAGDRHGTTSLNFYLVGKYFDSIQPSHKQQLASLICKELLGPDSTQPARISWKMANLLLAAVSSAGDGYFNFAMDEILWSLTTKFSSLAKAYLESGLGGADSAMEATILLEEEVQHILALPRQLSPMKRRSTWSKKIRNESVAEKGMVMKRGRSKSVLGRILAKRENAPKKTMFTPFRHSVKKPPKQKGTIDIGTELMVSCFSSSIHSKIYPHYLNNAIVRYYDKNAKNEGCEEVDIIAEKELLFQMGIEWTPSASKPNKLLQALKSAELITKKHHPVALESYGAGGFLVMYQDGSILVYCIDVQTGAIISVSEDTTVSSKLAEKTYGVVCSAVLISRKLLVFSLTHSPHIGRVLLDVQDDTSDQCPFPFSNTKLVKKLVIDKKKGKHEGSMLAYTGSLVFQWWVSPVENYNLCMFTATDDLFVFMKEASIPGNIIAMFPRQKKKVYVLSRVSVSSSCFEYTLCCSFTREQSFFMPHRTYHIRCSSPIVTADLSPDEGSFCFFTGSGTIMVLCMHSKRLYGVQTLYSNVVSMAFHSSSSFFTILTRNGNVACFDQALNKIKLATSRDAEYTTPFSLDLSKFHLNFRGIAGSVWLPNVVSATTKKGTKFSDRFVVIPSGGTPFHLQFAIPSSSILAMKGQTMACLCLAHLRVGQIEDAVALSCELNWMVDPQVSFHVFHSIINELLTMENDPHQFLNIKNCIPSFVFSPKQEERSHLSLVIKVLKAVVSQYVVQGKFINALTLITEIQNAELCELLVTLTEACTNPLQITIHAAAKEALAIITGIL